MALGCNDLNQHKIRDVVVIALNKFITSTSFIILLLVIPFTMYQSLWYCGCHSCFLTFRNHYLYRMFCHWHNCNAQIKISAVNRLTLIISTLLYCRVTNIRLLLLHCTARPIMIIFLSYNCLLRQQLLPCNYQNNTTTYDYYCFNRAINIIS